MSAVAIKEAVPSRWMWLKCCCGKSLEQKLHGNYPDNALSMYEILTGFLRDHSECRVPEESSAEERPERVQSILRQHEQEQMIGAKPFRGHDCSEEDA